jgi:hypothetical protein
MGAPTEGGFDDVRDTRVHPKDPLIFECFLSHFILEKAREDMFSADESKLGRFHRTGVLLARGEQPGDGFVIDGFIVSKEDRERHARHVYLIQHELLLGGCSQAAELGDEVSDGAIAPEFDWKPVVPTSHK